MVSADDGWAVGDHGTMLHWDGNAWTRVVAPTTSPLHDVSMISATDGWAVGGSATILIGTAAPGTRLPVPVTSTSGRFQWSQPAMAGQQGATIGGITVVSCCTGMASNGARFSAKDRATSLRLTWYRPPTAMRQP